MADVGIGHRLSEGCIFQQLEDGDSLKAVGVVVSRHSDDDADDLLIHKHGCPRSAFPTLGLVGRRRYAEMEAFGPVSHRMGLALQGNWLRASLADKWKSFTCPLLVIYRTTTYQLAPRIHNCRRKGTAKQQNIEGRLFFSAVPKNLCTGNCSAVAIRLMPPEGFDVLCRSIANYVAS